MLYVVVVLDDVKFVEKLLFFGVDWMVINLFNFMVLDMVLLG